MALRRSDASRCCEEGLKQRRDAAEGGSRGSLRKTNVTAHRSHRRRRHRHRHRRHCRQHRHRHRRLPSPPLPFIVTDTVVALHVIIVMLL
eukprot:11228342-Lingulodinium_polyedra.AAC.1